MFRKGKILSPPSAPTLNEILEDLETFKVEKRSLARTRVMDPDNPPETEWWKIFETFLQDVEDFKKMKTNLNGYKIKLESSQLEIDAAAKNIRRGIDENLEMARVEIKDKEEVGGSFGLLD